MGISWSPGDQWWKPSALPSQSPVRVGVSSSAAIANDPIAQRLKAGGVGLTNAALDSAYNAAAHTTTSSYSNTPKLAAPKVASSGGAKKSSGGGGRRGGGGGGAVAPAYSQAQIDWLTQLLARSKPTNEVATTIDLPDWQGKFDPSMYDQLTGQFNQAVASDRAAAQQAYQNLNSYLTNSYQNAFQQPNYQTQGPGMNSQQMQSMMVGQGVNPAVAAQQVQGQAAGNAAFSNLWRILGANEDTAQANRLRNAQINQGVTDRALDVAALQGQTGIGLQRSQAQAAYQQQVDQMNYQTAQQEAMQNWQRANQVADLNTSNQNSYINAQMQALLGLFPELKGSKVAMPNLDTLMAGR